ncbi:Radical SAM domain protein [Methanohalobium evestigatum Z-7303]|uniref:Radical SAM domain protein n=1 Tax=Methanohalobium evestigatum (strain ATCC BAA-1072 / DSM 3721 / NBRC 107634 / OCM 161 / Z-7303) TaxID=644295 RepID=D7E7D5_METEZ|nr:radical SAM protein [Methanohalobium evestigatum]ADI73884.1 Radical SAM domain protein [Methanohalobium evestigatum Z-7303]
MSKIRGLFHKGDISPKIILTADETLMSQYRWGMFVGFSTCIPKGLIPDWMFFSIWSPSVKSKNGRVLNADCGLRIIEASLADKFGTDEVAVVHPNDIDKVAGDRTEIIAITGHDYLGINPPTSEFVDIVDIGPPLNRVKFFDLMKKPIMKEKTVIAGGKSAWQLADESLMDKLNIDYVHLGRGEITVPEIVESIFNGEKPSRIIEGKEPNVDNIPNIKGATIHGLVEVFRGCGRGCSFCTPTMQKLHFKPIEHILQDVQTNVNFGQHSIILHSEDILRYGAKGIKPNSEQVLDLFKQVVSTEGVDKIGTSHLALATVYSNPELVESVTDTCYSELEQNSLGAQTGIETGSTRLIARYMEGKSLPESPEKWQEVVKQAYGILDDNNWITAATLINGLPSETTDDINTSIELVKDLKGTSSLIVPMNFVSMKGSALDNEESFTMDKMKPEHWQLMGECIEHDLEIVPHLLKNYKNDTSIKSWILEHSLKKTGKRINKYVNRMKRGEPPTDNTEPSKWLNPDLSDF